MSVSQANDSIEKLIKVNTESKEREQEIKQSFPFDLESSRCHHRLNEMCTTYFGKQEDNSLQIFAKLSYINCLDKNKLVTDAI